MAARQLIVVCMITHTDHMVRIFFAITRGAGKVVLCARKISAP